MNPQAPNSGPDGFARIRTAQCLAPSGKVVGSQDVAGMCPKMILAVEMEAPGYGLVECTIHPPDLTVTRANVRWDWLSVGNASFSVRRGRGEPHRVFRRPFGLSHAAMAGASSMA
jgi:hypothetical protein